MENIAKVSSPAKINLFFSVTGLRNDGYHDIFSAKFFLKFSDAIKISISENFHDEIFCNKPFLDCRNNSIAKVLELFRRETGKKNFFSIELIKNIPHEAGFGGGSSNAATVLLAMNKFFKNPLSHTETSILIRKIGTDCAFFLQKNASIVTGSGEVVEEIDNSTRSALTDYNCLIFKPKFGISTHQAYAILKEKFKNLYISEQEAMHKFDVLRSAIQNSEISLPLYNTFSEIFFSQHEKFRKLCKDLKSMGANVSLTGSGSGFFCLIHKSLDILSDAKTMILNSIEDIEILEETELIL